MRISKIAIWLVLVTFLAFCGGGFSGDTLVRSRILRLDPDTGRPGDIIVAYGEQLDQSRVEELLLTNRNCTALVTIIQQNEVSIRFRIPAHLPAGRYTVVIQ